MIFESVAAEKIVRVPVAERNVFANNRELVIAAIRGKHKKKCIKRVVIQTVDVFRVIQFTVLFVNRLLAVAQALHKTT